MLFKEKIRQRSRHLSQYLQVSVDTVRRELQKLIKLGLITKHGEGKSTYYA
jgi:DeoR/GlpR family transcriptional regulator of sugar metabolism